MRLNFSNRKILTISPRSVEGGYVITENCEGDLLKIL